jgi:hypothetical protein
MTLVFQTELLNLLNTFKHFAPHDLYNEYFNEFKSITEARADVFPENLLNGISLYLDSTDFQRSHVIRDNADWNKFFTDIMIRFNTIKKLQTDRTALSQKLKDALTQADKFVIFLKKCLQEHRSELFPSLERWSVNALNNLSHLIKDNVLIMGAGPIGLITAYFMKKSMGPFLNITVYDKRPDYNRDYHLLITEDTFDSLPHQIKSAVWGAGGSGCYILPPPIDAKGYCFINPPNNIQVPPHLFLNWYPDELFDTLDHRTGNKKVIKKLMSIPIKVFETKMYELIRSQFPDVNFIKQSYLNIKPSLNDGVNGFNRLEFKDADGNVVAKELFTNDFMHNFYIDATGAQPPEEDDDNYFNRTMESFYKDKRVDKGLTINIKHDPITMGTLKEYMNDKTIDIRIPQDNSRLFTPNKNYPTLLLSIRNLPADQELGQNLLWNQLTDQTRTKINNVYFEYFGKNLNPDLITQINIFEIRLGQADKMYVKSNAGPQDTEFYGVLLGDSACAVHYFSGTGINNGIKMATKLTELMNKMYQSRWSVDLDKLFHAWEVDMKQMCTETLKKSEKYVKLKK